MNEVPFIPMPLECPGIDITYLTREIFEKYLKESTVFDDLRYQNLSVSLLDQVEKDIVEDAYRDSEYHNNVSEDISSLEKQLLENCLQYKISKRDDKKLKVKKKSKKVEIQFENFLKDPKLDSRNKYPLISFSCLIPPPHVQIIESYEQMYIIENENFEKSQDDFGKIASSETDLRNLSDSLLKCEQPQRKRDSPKNQIFVASPDVIEFYNYQPGNTYTVLVKLQNITNRNGKFKILPFSQISNFMVVDIAMGKIILLAAGLTIHIKIMFVCQTLEVLQDVLKIFVPEGLSIDIPVVASRTLPILKTPVALGLDTSSLSPNKLAICKTIDFGATLIGHRAVINVMLYNLGDSGRFWIVSQEDWLWRNLANTDWYNTLHIEPFTLRPAYFSLQKNERIELEVEFMPEGEGFEVEQLYIVCDCCSVLELEVLGDAFIFEFNMLQFFEQSNEYDAIEHSDLRRRRWEKMTGIDTVNGIQYLLDLGNIPQSMQEEKHISILNKFELSPGTLSNLTYLPKCEESQIQPFEHVFDIKYYNNFDLQIHFEWKLLVNDEEIDADTQVVDIIPQSGILYAKESEKVLIYIDLTIIPPGNIKIELELYLDYYPSDCSKVPESAKLKPLDNSDMCLAVMLIAQIHICLYSEPETIEETIKEIMISSVEDSMSTKSFDEEDYSPRSTKNFGSGSVRFTPASGVISIGSMCAGTYEYGGSHMFGSLTDIEIDASEHILFPIHIANEVSGEEFAPLHGPTLRPISPLFKGIPMKQVVLLLNKSDTEKTFFWEAPFGQDANNIKFNVSPKRGTVSPNSFKTIDITIVPSQKGEVTDLHVPLFSGNVPIILSAEFIVKDLQVTFELPDPPLVIFQNFPNMLFATHILWDTCSALQPRGIPYVTDFGPMTSSEQSFSSQKETLSSTRAFIDETVRTIVNEVSMEEGKDKCSASLVQSYYSQVAIRPFSKSRILSPLPTFEPRIKHRLAQRMKTSDEANMHVSSSSAEDITDIFQSLEHRYQRKYDLLTDSQTNLKISERSDLIVSNLNVSNRSSSKIVSQSSSCKTDEMSEIRDYNSISQGSINCCISNLAQRESKISEHSTYSKEPLKSTMETQQFDDYSEESKSFMLEEKSESLIQFMTDIVSDTLPMRNVIEIFDLPCYQVSKKVFVIRNETPIVSTFRIDVNTHGERKVKKPSAVAEAKWKVHGEVEDQWHLKIQEGKGLVVIVKPSCSSLNANEAVPVDVYVYANTWGVYYDQIICYVEGLQPFIIQLIVQVIGTPTAFVLRCANGTPQPTVRFGTLAYQSKSRERLISLKNNSYLKLYIAWHIFVCEPRETIEIGQDPFNLILDMLFPENIDGPFASDYKRKKKRPSLKINSPPPKLLQFCLEPYNGYENYDYFEIKSKETELEPFGTTNLTLKVNPCICDDDTRFVPLRAVLIGYIYISEKDQYCPNTYERLFGHDIKPIKVLLHANVEIPRLSVESPQSEYAFTVFATNVLDSPILEFKETKFISVRNNDESTLTAKFSVPKPFKILRICSKSDNDPHSTKTYFDTSRVTLHNKELAKIHVQCCISANFIHNALLMLREHSASMMELISESEIKRSIKFEDLINVIQSEDIQQNIPVEVTIIFPIIQTSQEILDFGTLYCNESKSLPLILTNATDAVVNVEIILKNEIKYFRFQPGYGILDSASSGNNTLTVWVTYTPTSQQITSVEDCLVILSNIPDDSVSVVLTGSGAPNQRFLHQRCTENI